MSILKVNKIELVSGGTLTTPPITTPAINVGTATGAGTGEIKTSGAIRQSTAIGAGVRHSAAQTISNNTWTYLAFNTEDWDSDGCHDTVTNNSRLTCKTAGVYLITGAVGFAANVTGERSIILRLNGNTFLASQRTNAISVAGAETWLTISVIVALAVNDYVELGALQASGGNLSVFAYHGLPNFSMVRVA